MYEVICLFADLQDKNYIYNPADPKRNTYPREGLKPTPERIAELSGSENKQGRPLIKAIEKADCLENMKIEDLKAYAEEKGIDLEGLTRKGDILAKIKEAQAKAAE